MDVGSALRVLLRQWLVVLIGVALTVGACAYLYKTAEPRYQATGRMLLLLPADARGPDAIGSPFLYLPNGLNVLARIVSGASTGRQFRQEMAAQGLSPSFEVGVDPETPIIIISVEDTEPDNVVRTRDWLITAMNDELLKVQQEEGAPPAQTAHTRVYAAEDVPSQLGGDWTRSVLAALAAGGIVTLVAAFAIDRLRALRRERRQRKLAEASADQGLEDEIRPAGAESHTDSDADTHDGPHSVTAGAPAMADRSPEGP
ncbi:hypothetical protein LKO27_14505 [Tessaracoccus sp. OS52]|uniref:hypothetical protein n=1 Tax=Tessaracoccus sp. OS52 TaxID=2886691 RepID=UPI001D1211F6|nr:hypothetical protein [Tessaracoccus sp. OS52]MCC2594613.1 hypothetical protein [Tessaracoccus sp. OS52]